MTGIVLKFPTMTIPDHKLPNRIRYWRKARNLTQQQLADRINMRVQTFNRYETGVRPTSLEALNLIARALDVEAADLLPPEMNQMALTPAEKVLLTRYRAAPPLGRKNLDALAESIADYSPEPVDLQSYANKRR